MISKKHISLHFITIFLLLLLTNIFSAEKLWCDQCENEIKPGTIYVISSGKIFCDQECFEKSLPKCVVCGKPVINGFKSKGSSYCSEECLSSTWNKCSLCGKRISSGFHFSNKDGAYFCKDCMEKPKCFLCGHPGNCKELSDGRLICPNCEKTAINDLQAAEKIFDEVRFNMKEKLGLSTDNIIRFKLVSVQELNEEYKSISSDECMEHGLFIHEQRIKTIVKTRTLFGFEIGKKTEEVVKNNYLILILFSLRKDKFIEVAAHELAHDWMEINYPNIKDLKISEGWAEFVASQINNHYGNSYLNARMKNNPSPTYGDGYRYVAGYAKEHGVGKLFKLFEEMNKK
ncbi:MAG: protein DA1 [Candidatus Delongbacteria bacterium]|nr:protein DA1 [Candidatus Delongbacteria bacterium]